MVRQAVLALLVLGWFCCGLAAIGPREARGAEPDVNARDDEGRTALMFAAMLGQTKVLESLLNDGAEVNVADNGGVTALMVAARSGYQDIVEILLRHDARIDAKSKQNATALIMAAAQGRRDVVRTLVEAGADLTPKDVRGRTALDYARLADDQEMVALLENPPEPQPELQQQPEEEAEEEQPEEKQEEEEEQQQPVAAGVIGEDGREYQTIREAVEQAKPGARIVVRPGVYRESLLLDKEVEIVGEGPRERIVIESADADCILMYTDRAAVRGLTLRCVADEQDNFYAVDVLRGRLLLEDCDVTSKSLACIEIHGETSNPTIRKCWIRDGSGAGVFVYDGGQGTVEDCEIFGNALTGVAVAKGGDPLVRRCRIHHGQEKGVFVFDSGRGTFEDCDVYRNAGKEIALESGGKADFRRCHIASYEDPPEKLLSIDTVETNLGDEDTRVDPELRQIVLSFAQPMDTQSWFVGKADEEYGELPTLSGDRPAFFRDPRTFVLSVELNPDTKYAFTLNEEGNWAFRSAEGVPLEPTIVYFQTAEAPEEE